MKSEDKLQAFQKEISDGDCIKKRKTVKKADLLVLDKAVYLWFIQQRCKGEHDWVACLVLWVHMMCCLFFCAGTTISGPLLMSKALQLYPLVYPDDENPCSFKAGTGWLKRFKDRHGVRALSVQGESLSAAVDTVEPFKEKLSKIMEENL